MRAIWRKTRANYTPDLVHNFWCCFRDFLFKSGPLTLGLGWVWLNVAAFSVSAVTHPKSHTNKQCEVLHSYADSRRRHAVTQTAAGNPSEAHELENPILPSSSRPQHPPLLWWKERKHLCYSPPLFIYLQNYTLLFLDHVPMCFVMFPFKQNLHACGLVLCLASTCTNLSMHTPIQLSPLCQRSPLPSPSPLPKHRRTAKENFKVAGGGTPFFLALVII